MLLLYAAPIGNHPQTSNHKPLFTQVTTDLPPVEIPQQRNSFKYLNIFSEWKYKLLLH
jgi:hypothetical protein